MDYSKCMSIADIWNSLQIHNGELDPDFALAARYFFYMGAAGINGLMGNIGKLPEKERGIAYDALICELSAFTQQCLSGIEEEKASRATLQ